MNNHNLTSGSIIKKVALFAIPLLIGSVIQQLYNTVDLLFAGNLINASASAAIGASSQLITCMVGFFSGLGVGCGVIASQYFGAKDKDSLGKAVHNAMALALLGGVILIVFGFCFAPLYFSLVNVPEYLLDTALGYIRIYFLSIVSTLIYDLGTGLLRAMGDSRSTLTAQLLGGLMNVVMDFLFIRVFGFGVTGIAWATLVSQTFAALVVVIKLRKVESEYRLEFRRIRLYGDMTKEVLRIGVPAGSQILVIALSNVFAHYHINSLGYETIVAFTAYFKIELLIYYPIVALGQAAMTFAGQNAGAGNMKRVRKGTSTILIFSIFIAEIISIVAFLLCRTLFGFFCQEEEIISLGAKLITVTFPFYWIYCILQVLGDSMRGLGHTRAPMLIIMANICVVRTILLYLIVPAWLDIRAIGVTYPITWFLAAVGMTIYYLGYYKKNQV